MEITDQEISVKSNMSSFFVTLALYEMKSGSEMSQSNDMIDKCKTL